MRITRQRSQQAVSRRGPLDRMHADTQEIDDAALVAACRRGDVGAWERMVRRFERLIYTVPRRAGLAADDAADVFQTVFQRLHEHLESLNRPDRVQAWLVTTARRETLRLLGLRRNAVPLGGPATDENEDVVDLADPDPLPEQVLDELQQHHRVRLVLQRLDDRCRSLLGLLYGAEEPPAYTEIAVQLGVPIGSIGPTRARCLAKLRTLFEALPR